MSTRRKWNNILQIPELDEDDIIIMEQRHSYADLYLVFIKCAKMADTKFRRRHYALIREIRLIEVSNQEDYKDINPSKL